MGRPITATWGGGSRADAVIGDRSYQVQAAHGLSGGTCYCQLTGFNVNLTGAADLPELQRGWYRIRADGSAGKDRSGIAYSYDGTYEDLDSLLTAQYARLDFGNVDDPNYSGGGTVTFYWYSRAIGPLDPSCVPPSPNDPGTDYPYFNTDEWYRVSVSGYPVGNGYAFLAGGRRTEGVFTRGASCTITATPRAGYEFSHWSASDGSTASTATHTFTVAGDVAWTAHFTRRPTYAVAVAASPEQGGAVSGGGTYYRGDSCTITATPYAGYGFSHWTASDGSTASTATHSFTVTGEVTWTAHFTRVAYTVTVVASPAAGGTVSGGGTYHYGDSCTITATPNSGKPFKRWEASDGSSAGTATHTFTVTGNVTWTAIFQEGWLIKVRIVRGAQLGYIARPTTWRATRTDNYRTLDFTAIENTPTSYVAVVEPVAFNLVDPSNDFKVHLNDESASEIALVRVVKGWEPGDYTKDTPVVGSCNLHYVPANYGVRCSLDFDGAEVEIYLRRKSTGELLYDPASGALLCGKAGAPIYL